MVNYTRHVRSRLSAQDEHDLALVDRMAERVQARLSLSAREIEIAHVHNAKSGEIQTLVSAILLGELGFDEEVVLRPEDEFVTQARPDFYFDLGDERGILAEVERGGTTTKNHDLKDLWKAHVAPNAQQWIVRLWRAVNVRPPCTRRRPGVTAAVLLPARTPSRGDDRSGRRAGGRELVRSGVGDRHGGRPRRAVTSSLSLSSLPPHVGKDFVQSTTAVLRFAAAVRSRTVGNHRRGISSERRRGGEFSTRTLSNVDR